MVSKSLVIGADAVTGSATCRVLEDVVGSAVEGMGVVTLF